MYPGAGWPECDGSSGYRRTKTPGRWDSGIDVYEYEEGSIVIDFVDSDTNELIYRSKVSAIISRNIDFEQRRKNIQKAVRKILENFPPKN